MRVSSLDRPKSYYHGMAEKPFESPHNIILFSSLSALGENHGNQHHRFVLIFNFETCGSVIVDDKVIPLLPNQGVLVHPYQFHQYVDFADRSICWLWVTFEYAYPKDLLPLKSEKFTISEFHIAGLMEMIRFYKEKNSDALGGMLSTLLSDWRSRRSKKRNENQESANPLISQLASMIYEDLDGDLSISALAERVHMSPSHLRARFKKITGEGLATYVRRTRIHRACVDLTRSEMNVSTISEKCGYDSLYSFSRAFRQMMGMSPTEWRREKKA